MFIDSFELMKARHHQILLSVLATYQAVCLTVCLRFTGTSVSPFGWPSLFVLFLLPTVLSIALDNFSEISVL